MKKEKLHAKRMTRNKKSFIFITILCMGVGFALLSSNLTITGNTNVSGNSWKVYFNSVGVTNGSVDATTSPTITGTNTTSVDYTILLDKPGDFYEFTIEAKNDGTIDAMVDSITTPNIASRILQYLNYSVKYSDGSDVKVTDVLKAKTSTTYKIRIEYRTDIVASDLDENEVNLDLTFGISYTQSYIKDSNFVKLVKSNALSDSIIDFTQRSSASNGEGLYVLSGTENRAHPIYYYRGAVTNNNAKFAGFCWKIVRTTETGGTKLIYNGVPNETTGECDATEDATQLERVAYNTNSNSPAYNGYMYGTVYTSQYAYASINTGYVYGRTFTYENGIYTLIDTQTELDATHHYTCLTSDTTCSSVKYVYDATDYFTLSNGKSIEDLLLEMQQNTTDSDVKTAVDNWFSNTFAAYFTTKSKDYNSYLEDTVWCNDRSVAFDVIDSLSYNTFERLKAGTPTIECSNKNDSFTVEESDTGNGALDYPVGLLTSDELNLAGGIYDSWSNFYLDNGKYWWTMSPLYHKASWTYQLNSYSGYVGINGTLFGSSPHGYRPAISLKSEVKIASGGNGTSATPYEFVVE